MYEKWKWAGSRSRKGARKERKTNKNSQKARKIERTPQNSQHWKKPNEKNSEYHIQFGIEIIATQKKIHFVSMVQKKLIMVDSMARLYIIYDMLLLRLVVFSCRDIYWFSGVVKVGNSNHHQQYSLLLYTELLVKSSDGE